MKPSFPPYVLEILWNRLIAIAEEQAQVLMRAAFSTIVREAGDLSAAIFDRRGRMIAQAHTGTPGHINTMALGMRHFLAEFPIEMIEPGDVLLSNDPYKFAGQLNDMNLVTPVFNNGKLVAFFASCCHMVDIGGVGLTADARSVYEEGLQVPICKFLLRGEPNRIVFDFIKANVRSPKEVVGDLYAQVSGGEVGAKRLVEMLAEFELADVEALSDEIITRSEAAVLDAAQAFPNGRFEFSCENDGFDAPIHIQVAIERKGEHLVVDFGGTDPALEKGINVPLAYTTAYATYAVKCILAPGVPNNAGSFVPIKVQAPEGSILNPVYPSPTAARHIIGHFLPSVVFGALEPAFPGQVPADSAAGLWVTQLSGRTRDNEAYTFAFFACGGMGARPELDGLSVTSFPSESRTLPPKSSKALRQSSSTSVSCARIRAVPADTGADWGRPFASRSAPWPRHRIGNVRQGSICPERRGRRIPRTVGQGDRSRWSRLAQQGPFRNRSRRGGHADAARRRRVRSSSERDPEAADRDIRGGYVTPQRGEKFPDRDPRVRPHRKACRQWYVMSRKGMHDHE